MEDPISVNRIVEELNMETLPPVLLYKPQEEIDSNFLNSSKDTLLLVLMTDIQVVLFTTFSQN